MKTYMNDDELKSVNQVRDFLAGTQSVRFMPASKKERYTWLAKSLRWVTIVCENGIKEWYASIYRK